MPILDVVKPLIVNLRRGIDVEANWTRFREAIEKDVDAVCRELDTRWLVSVCDTYADFGEAVEQRNAMLISTVANMEKIGQSWLIWRVNYRNPFEVPPDREPRRIKLWDGMDSMHLVVGDVTNHLFRRLDVLLAPTPHLRQISHTVLKRMAENDTILGAINRYHKHVFETGNAWRDAPEYDEWKGPRRRARGRLSGGKRGPARP